jgi:hypothetical protein
MPDVSNRPSNLAGLSSVDQDSDHGFFDLPGGEPPALRAIRSCLSDQGSGGVVSIAPAFLDGV